MLTPTTRAQGIDEAALVAQAAGPILASSSGPSRSTTRARCATSMAGAIASEVATMQPTMMAKPRRSASAASASASVRPPALVELDVDGVVFAGECVERSAIVHAFVGADRNRPLDARRAHRRCAFRQGLLDQRDAGIGAGGEILREIVCVPALVGIDDQFGLRRCAAHRRDPLTVIAAAAELDLEQRPRRRPLRRRRHVRRREPSEIV